MMRPSPGPSSNISKKTSSDIGTLKRVRPFINQDTAAKAYKALIKLYVNYCSSVWDGLGQHVICTWVISCKNYRTTLQK